MASGTATFPGHCFVFTPVDDPHNILERFVMREYPDNIHVYDPYYTINNEEQTSHQIHSLSAEERVRYKNWRDTITFHEQYRIVTGRSYLANYLRSPPSHFMWRADYFGQEYWVATPQVQFVRQPPSSMLGPMIGMNTEPQQGQQRMLRNTRILPQYRHQDNYLNLTIRVLSCAPRVFEIPNFLSDIEYNHILDLASTLDLKLSSTGDISGGDDVSLLEDDSHRTRTSFNSWLAREASPIVDVIYRRAADLLRIDESLLRYRAEDEYPEMPTKHSIAESLQLVHYSPAQEYTAHHDFGFSRIDDKHQGARFATLLLYLNDDMSGGETSFPRWVNAETFKELKVKPEKGKAVLFYSQLPGEYQETLNIVLFFEVTSRLIDISDHRSLCRNPLDHTDGNLDDFSQHAANPVIKGEKVRVVVLLWLP